MELSGKLGKLRLVAHPVNHVEVGNQLAVSALVDGHGVHARVVEIANLLCHASLHGGFVMSHLFNNLFELQLRTVANL